MYLFYQLRFQIWDWRKFVSLPWRQIVTLFHYLPLRTQSTFLQYWFFAYDLCMSFRTSQNHFCSIYESLFPKHWLGLPWHPRLMVLGLSLKVEVPCKRTNNRLSLWFYKTLFIVVKNIKWINLEIFGLPHECPKHQYIVNSLELLAQWPCTAYCLKEEQLILWLKQAASGLLVPAACPRPSGETPLVPCS